MRLRFLFAFLFYTAVSATAQTGTGVSEVRLKYSGYNAVVSDLQAEYVFDIVGDSLQIKMHTKKEVLFLNNNTKAFTSDYISYGSFSSLKDVDVFTLVPKGKSYEKIAVTRFNESHDLDGGSFYDDSKTISFAYPSITEGAVTSLNYTVLFNDPRFINRFFFQSFIPVIRSKVTVRVNSNVSIGYKLVNGGSVNISFKEYVKGKYRYYEWEATDIAPYKYVSTEYHNTLHFSPHLALFVREAKTPGGVKKIYGTVDDLYRLDYEFISGMKQMATNDLKKLVDDLILNKNDDEKAKAIYYWVQDNIKYVAYSDGYQGFIPAAAAEVFAKRFGDCKGMTSLIKTMMDLAGLPAYYAWVGTRTIPYTYEDMPLSSVDNHMVAAYRHGDSIIIMDGTFRHLDFGLYPYHIQGKEVLISLDPEKYMIFTVPVSPLSKSMVYDSVSIALSQQTIKGVGKRIHTGFNRAELAAAMDGVKESDYQKRFSTLFQKGNNKFRVDTSDAVNIFEHDRPAEVLYSFTLDDYAKVLGDEIYVNLNLDKPLQNGRIDTTGQYSLVTNDFRYEDVSITLMSIPEGYTVEYLPESNTIGNTVISASFDYFADSGYVMLKKIVKYNFLIIPEEMIAEWNKIIDQLNNNYRISVVLKKINNK